MTVQQALIIIESTEKQIKNKIIGIHDPKESWNKANEKLLDDVVEMQSQTLNNWLETLIILKNALDPKCDHPKNMIAYCNNQPYCMDCNFDIITKQQINQTNPPEIIKMKMESRRKLVLKYAQQNMTQKEIANKINCSLSTVEKDCKFLKQIPIKNTTQD